MKHPPGMPQAERRLIIAILVLAGLLTVTGIVAIYLLATTERLSALAFVPAPVVLLGGVVAALAARSFGEAGRHITPDGGHRCRCVGCGRAGEAAGAAVDHRPGTALASNTVRALVFLCAAIVCAVVLAFLFSLVRSVGSTTWILALGGALVVGLLALVSAVNLRREPQSTPAGHGCACRWCGAPLRSL